MHILRLLTQADLPALLAFERHNRSYFEQWVPPRPSWFFDDSARSVSHMKSLLKEQHSGVFLMYILIDQSRQILGRVNLTISSQPSLGYRIAKAHAGQGLASLAVKRICVTARDTLGLPDISAQAAQDNLASQKVLTNNGFARSKSAAQEVQLNDKPIFLDRFHKTL